MTALLGFNAHRQRLLAGLREGLALLQAAHCPLVYIDGSFVTNKPEPADFDACWSVEGTDVDALDIVFLTFARKRARQRERFSGEFFPADLPSGPSGLAYLEFFQIDKTSGQPKGIISLELAGLFL